MCEINWCKAKHVLILTMMYRINDTNRNMFWLLCQRCLFQSTASSPNFIPNIEILVPRVESFFEWCVCVKWLIQNLCLGEVSENTCLKQVVTTFYNTISNINIVFLNLLTDHIYHICCFNVKFYFCCYFTFQSSLDEATDPWGIKVERVEMWVDIFR